MNKKKIPKIPFVLVGVAVIFIIFSFAVIRVSLPPTEEVFIFSAFSGGGSVSDLSGLHINNDVIAGDLAGNFALPFAALQSGQSSFTTWYLAEGCTNGFDTWVLIQNPGANEAQVKVTFMDQDGNTVEITPDTDPENTILEPYSRSTIYVNRYLPDKDVSTIVESINGEPIIVERAMYWLSGGQDWVGGHDSVGVTSASTIWYLAEGCTRGFDAWILIQNPGDSEAEVKVTFMDQYGNTEEMTPYTDPESTILEPHSRSTIYVNRYMPDRDVSTTVESINGESIIVERAMYWNSGGIEWVGGHDSVGVTSADTTWYLAEGCTRGFDAWILIQNPTDSEAWVNVTFMDQDGNTVEVTPDTDPEETILEPYSRSTININRYLPDKDVSTTVESANGVPVIVERAMYWNGGGIEWVGGHDCIGVNSAAGAWSLAEGCTRGFDTWVLVQNPGASEARIKVTFMDQDGNTVEITPDTDPEETILEAYSRSTIYVNRYLPEKDVSTTVESINGEQVIVERAMYWNGDGIEWVGGHDCVGTVSQN